MINSHNPFIDRGAVREATLFFGRRNETRKLAQAIGSRSPQSCSIIGERRIGKTSLLNYLADPGGALKEFANLLNEPAQNYIFIRADLSALKIKKRDGAVFFFRQIFRNLHEVITDKCKQTGIKSKKLAKIFDNYIERPDLSELSEFGLGGYLSEIKRIAPEWVLVFLLDEADALIKHGVGALLRSLIQDRAISFVLVTRLPLVEIDPEREVSPLFNIIAEKIPLGLMPEKECRQMVLNLTSQSGMTVTVTELDFIMKISGGNPDYAKTSAKHVMEAKLERKHIDFEALKANIYLDLDSACKGLWEGMEESERSVCIKLTKEQSLENIDTKAAQILKRKGILNEQGEFFSIAFADFVSDKSPASSLQFEKGYVKYDNQIIKVSPKELSLLQYLYKHVGQTCTREEIYKKVWGETFDENSTATINMTIKRLREKLDTSIEGAFSFESVRGEGYSLTMN